MIETCYARGKRILLLSEQRPDGTWICRFSIPNLVNTFLSGRRPVVLTAYRSELEAKLAAFASAKRMLNA